MNRYRNSLGRLTSLALLGVALAGARDSAQTRPSAWYAIDGPTPNEFTQRIQTLVTTVIRRRNPDLLVTPGRREAIYRVLGSQNPNDLLFISGTAADVRSLVTDDRLGVVAKLNLELLNVRMGATPLFLFTRSDQVQRIYDKAAPPVRVVYASRAGALQPTDVQGLLGRVLRNAQVAPALNSPVELARRLLSDANVAGIYDNDPSLFLREFLNAYETQRKDAAAGVDTQLVQVTASQGGTADAQGKLQPLEGNLAFAVVKFEDVAVENLPGVRPLVREPMLAVSPEPRGAASNTLWVLSNVRRVAGPAEHLRVRQLLGNAYYAALFERQDFAARCEGAVELEYPPYLLDAHVGDPQNLPKGLALWSDLVLRGGRATDAAVHRDQLTLVEVLLQERLKVQVATTAGRTAIAERLKAPGGTTRQQFSDADSTLFEQSVRELREGLAAKDATARKSRLNVARAMLLALIKKGDGPACTGGRDLGLFGKGLDPYFYLGLVDAYLALEGSTP